MLITAVIVVALAFLLIVGMYRESAFHSEQREPEDFVWFAVESVWRGILMLFFIRP